MPRPVQDGRPVIGPVAVGDKMKLLEFFNPQHDKLELGKEGSSPRDNKLEDAVYFHIIDNDSLHKQYVLPVAFELDRVKDTDNFDRRSFCKKLIPMVKTGCMNYCHNEKLEDVPSAMLEKGFFLSIAQRLLDQMLEDLKNDAYGFSKLRETSKKQKSDENVGEDQMSAPSGPQYDTTGNNSLNESELEDMRKLAGIKSSHWKEINKGSNISLTGMEKAKLMKEHNIKPGTPEWFKLWFARTYMTQEKPIG